MIKHILYIFSCFVIFVGEKMQQTMMWIFKGNWWANVVWVLQKKDTELRTSWCLCCSQISESVGVSVQPALLPQQLTLRWSSSRLWLFFWWPVLPVLVRTGFWKVLFVGCNDIDVLVCAEAFGDMGVCYILDGILVLFGAILTILYFRLKVRATE